MKCRGLVLQAIAELLERYYLQKFHHDVSHLDLIIEAINTIEKNLCRELSISGLASSAKLSVSRFRALFTRVTGVSPIQYRNRTRMEYARDLLLSGEFNVSEAANTIGYDNVFYFSRLFKKIIGTTPASFKK